MAFDGCQNSLTSLKVTQRGKRVQGLIRSENEICLKQHNTHRQTRTNHAVYRGSII